MCPRRDSIRNGQIVNINEHPLTIEVECDEGYTLRNDHTSITACLDGRWNTTKARCVRTCEPFSSDSFVATECYNHKNVNISCSLPLPARSRIVIKCRGTCDGNNVQYRTCMSSGNWSPEPATPVKSNFTYPIGTFACILQYIFRYFRL